MAAPRGRLPRSLLDKGLTGIEQQITIMEIHANTILDGLDKIYFELQ